MRISNTFGSQALLAALTPASFPPRMALAHNAQFSATSEQTAYLQQLQTQARQLQLSSNLMRLTLLHSRVQPPHADQPQPGRQPRVLSDSHWQAPVK